MLRYVFDLIILVSVINLEVKKKMVISWSFYGTTVRWFSKIKDQTPRNNLFLPLLLSSFTTELLPRRWIIISSSRKTKCPHGFIILSVTMISAQIFSSPPRRHLRDRPRIRSPPPGHRYLRL